MCISTLQVLQDQRIRNGGHVRLKIKDNSCNSLFIDCIMGKWTEMLFLHLIEKKNRLTCFKRTIIVAAIPQTLYYDNPPSQDQNLAQNAVTLKCQTGCSYPQPSFTWFYNESAGSSIQWSSPGSVSQIQDGCSDSEKKYTSALLLPKDSSFPDNMEKTVTFVCRITSFPGMTVPLNTTPSVNIQFAGSPNGPPSIQGFSDSDTLKVLEANQVTLSCSISGGNPLATLTWSCFNSGSSTVTVGKKVTKTVTWTTLRNTDRTCTCQSDHPVAGKQSVSIKIEILYPPTKPSLRINSRTVPATIDVIRNNPLTMTCSSSGNPVPSYKWTLPTTTTRDGSTLSVSSVQMEGRYKCDVENSMQLTNGSVITGSDSSSVDVNLLYPPSAPVFNYGSTTGPIISSGSMAVIKDDTFSVACTSDGEPAPTYKWDNLPNNRILTVSRITADQTHSCRASNTMKETVGETRSGSESAILSVSVQYPPRDVNIKYHYGPSSEMSITTLSIIEGNPCTVKCSSSSKPSPSYTWSGKVTSQSDSLIIESTDRTAHAGTYTCNVENTMIRSFANPQKEVQGTNNGSFTLQVLYPPKVRDFRNQSVVEGDPLTVTCPVTFGNPPETTYQWKRTANDKTWQSQTFTINRISRTDAMFYTCTVYNIMTQTGETAVALPHTGTFYLNVWYSASVTDFFVHGHEGKTTIKINETETVRFECIIDSNPGSAISIMYLDSTKLSMGGTKEVKYNIQSAMCTDRGAYKCLGFNQYNKDNSSKILNLLVNCSPRPSPLLQLEEIVTSALHTPAVLTFTTLAYPEPKVDDYRWFRWNDSAWLELSNSDEFRIETTVLQSNLTVTDINRTNFGTYKLEVKNTIGSHEQIFYLIREAFFVEGHRGQTNVTVDENDGGIRFICEVESNPNPTVKIMFNGEILKEGSNTKQISFIHSSVTCLDGGEYTCEGNNQYGHLSKKSITLFVKCSPRPLHEMRQNVTSALHVPVTLSFTALAYPSPGTKGFAWFRENGGRWTRVLSNADLRISSSELQSNLTILKVSTANYGRYRITVRNNLGNYSQYLFLEEDVLTEEGSPGTCVRYSEVDSDNTAVITGISLGLVVAALAIYSTSITILYKRKTTSKDSDSQLVVRESTQKTYENVAYNQNQNNDGAPEDEVDDARQYTDLVGYSRDDRTTYEVLHDL